MTDPQHYPVPPPNSTWTPQDPYAPYAGQGQSYQPYAGGPPPGQGPYEPYAGGPGYGTPPPYGMAPYGGEKPSAYWPLSIVGLLFSFLFGAIALYFSSQVGRRWNRGDVEGARKASRTARTLGVVAIVAGVIATVILVSADSR